MWRQTLPWTVAGSFGVALVASLVLFAPWEVTVLSAWIVAAATFAGRVWFRTHRLSAAQTAKVAPKAQSAQMLAPTT